MVQTVQTVVSYRDEDCDINVIRSKNVAIVGYGSQGSAQAKNLRDSGVRVIVGLYKGSKNWSKAEKDGFAVMEVSEAARAANLVMMLTPDEVQADVFKESVEPNMKRGDILGFSHGFSVRYGYISVPRGIGVIMIAPKGPGCSVRNEFIRKGGVPSLIAVHADLESGDARRVALSYAKAIGGSKFGVVETSFEHETETDLFGEQAVLCGGVVSLVKMGFETLVEAGYPEEMAYFECLHELKLTVDLMHKEGISGMRSAISNTARYGGIISGGEVVNRKSKEAMLALLKRIQDGTFANNLMMEKQSGYPTIEADRNELSNHRIEAVGRVIRERVLSGVRNHE